MIKKIRVLFFILGVLFIIIGFYFEQTKNTKVYDKVIGTWYEDSGMLFTFSENSFYWYKDFTNLKTNYYKGNIKITNLCDFHLTKEQIKEEYGNINCKDYYEIKLYPKELIKNQKTEKYKGNYYIKFALYFEKNRKAYLYDFRKNKFYDVAKIENF